MPIFLWSTVEIESLMPVGRAGPACACAGACASIVAISLSLPRLLEAPQTRRNQADLLIDQIRRGHAAARRMRSRPQRTGHQALRVAHPLLHVRLPVPRLARTHPGACTEARLLRAERTLR